MPGVHGKKVVWMIVRARFLVVAAAAGLFGSAAQAVIPNTTFASFSQVARRGPAPKIVSLKNLDTFKTTTTTIRTPIYGPVYDKKGKVIGTKITGYTTATTKASVYTPKSQLISTNGASTVFATPIVNFNFLVPVSGPFRSVLTGQQKAYFSLDTISNVAPTAFAANGQIGYSQQFGPGKISFTRTTPIQLYKANGQPNGPALSNLLTVMFDSAKLDTIARATTFSLIGSSPAQNLVFTSDFLGFDNATTFDFSLSMTGVSPSLSMAVFNPTLTNVTGQRTFNTTRGNVVGGFAANSVPEPESWALMILGLGLVGVTLRRRTVVVA